MSESAEKSDSGRRFRAPMDGTVTVASWDSSGQGLGNVVRIRHDDGSCTLIRCGLATPTVNVGERVAAGQVIGQSGTTGGTAPHIRWMPDRRP